MEHFPSHKLGYAVDDHYNVSGSNGHSQRSGRNGIDDDAMDSDFEEELELSIPSTDTSAFEARNGKDIQGIPWERFNYTRESYRQTRLRQYKNFESLHNSRGDLEKCKEVESGHNFYGFQYNTRVVKSTIVHFQAQTMSKVYISTMAVKDNLVVAGGFRGELICKYLNQPGVIFCTKLTTGENDITNSVDIYRNSDGSMRVSKANNDSQVRVDDASSFTCLSRFTFPWCVNNTSASPDGKLFAILGDSQDCLLADAESGKVLNILKGHLDYSFSSAWHPDGHILATGNQDKTCRLWDIRNLSESLAILKGRMGAIRSIRFTSDGRFMAMAEPADFIHIFNTQSGYGTAQEIGLFGEIAGVSFSPDNDAFFVSISDRTYGSLLEFKRRQYNHYLDYMI